MTESPHDTARTIVLEEVPDYYSELSEYLEVLSNSQRLKILKLLEKKPRDVRTIASEINTSYENTKKHLDKLISTGLIKKEVGLGQQTSKGVHPVWKYSLVPGAMEALIRNLGIFSNIKLHLADGELKKRLEEVREAVEDEITGDTPMAILLGGSEDGKVFLLQKQEVRVGRADPGNEDRYDPQNDIIFSADYTSVTRVTKPHGMINRQGSKWFIEDRGSKGGTFLNSTALIARKPEQLHDGDLIELAKGTAGVRLLIIIPNDNS